MKPVVAGASHIPLLPFPSSARPGIRDDFVEKDYCTILDHHMIVLDALATALDGATSSPLQTERPDPLLYYS